MWQTYALLSAFFAGLTAIFAKVGVSSINSNLATAVRTTVILIITWFAALSFSDLSQIKRISASSLLFLILSGCSTGLSWLFYFKALKISDASKVAPVDKLSVVFTVVLAFFILGEQPSLKVIAGCSLIFIGALTIII